MEGSSARLLNQTDVPHYSSINSSNMTDNPGFVTEKTEMEDFVSVVLSKQDKVFIRLADEDDVDGVKEHLQAFPRTNINAVDYQGRTALQIGVRNQCKPMVEFLLTQKGIKLRDALLFAIREENSTVIEILLDWEQNAKLKGYGEEPYDSAEFSSHMTPLMLACIEDQYETVRSLLVRGHTISVPSDQDYKDTDYATFGETLEIGLARIDSYRALASPTYLCLSTEDPILMAFTLSNEANKLAYADPIFKTQYEDLSQQCKNFAVGLLNQCRTSEEVWVLLRQNHGAEMGVKDGGMYPRLRLAMAYEQKEFLTHQNCQQVLQNLWTENNPDVMWMNVLQGLLYFVPRIFVSPFVYLAYIFLPFPSLFKYWEAPMCKFMGDLTSYCVFLVLLLLSILGGEENPGKRKPDLNGGIDVLIWIWVASFIWDHMKLIYHYGLKVYTKHWWLVYGLVMNLCFLTSFIARLSAYILSEEDPDYDVNLPRNYWPWDDPILVAEAMYSIATVFAFGRILYIFQISQILGPLQLSLSRMLYDISQMFFMIFVVMLAFATGLTRLYVYYEGAVRIDEEGEVVQEQEDAFTSWRSTFKTLYWNIFGFGEVEYADVVVGNTCGEGFPCANQTDVASHNITEGTGYVLYGMYHLIMVATLFNMLIGLMANTMTVIQENADQEWKFSRSRLWMQYLEDSGILPNPLNLIPTVHDILYLLRWLGLKICCRNRDEVAKWSKDNCWYIDVREDDEKIEHLKLKYKSLMQRLMKRYMNQREMEYQIETTVTPDDLEQLKIDLMKEMQRLYEKQDSSGQKKRKY